MDWDSPEIEALVTQALKEDIGSGDVSVAAVSPNATIRARLVTFDDIVCTGLPLVEKILSLLDADVFVEARFADGQSVDRESTLATVSGDAGAILSGKQAVLNLVSRLCGVATLTREFARQVAGTHAQIRDTRNTSPGLRLLEQSAVRMGGGVHHHAGLFDAIVLTHAHVITAGGIKAAVDQAHSYSSRLMNPAELTAYEAAGTIPTEGGASSLPIQIEIRNESELREAFSAGADSILLEDVTPDQARRLVECARGIRAGCVIEISGSISLTEAHAFAETGVDYLSPHALTTAAAWARLRLLVEGPQEKVS